MMKPGGTERTPMIESSVTDVQTAAAHAWAGSSGVQIHREARIVRGLDPVHRLKARENAAGSENPTR